MAFKHPKLRDALLAIAGRNGRIDGRVIHGKHIESRAPSEMAYKFEQAGERHKVSVWRLAPA